jgi:sporulation protein YlmC with PRC-barrel domain
MNKLTVLLTAILTVLLLAGPSFAGQTASGEKSPEMAASSYTENQLVGLSVFDKKGEEIGKIKEVNLNSETGDINFVILAEGGVMGIGEKRHAVPLAALNINRDEGKATLLVAKDKLEGVPEKTADVTDEEFKGIIEEYYGVAPVWQEGEGESGKMMERKEEYREKSMY